MTATASLRSVHKTIFLVLVAVLTVSVLVQPAAAQRGVGRMQGIVLDADGNGLEGVQIVATNPSATPNTRTGDTRNGGRWAIVGFSRGDWKFEFTMEGYIPFDINTTVSAANRNPPLNVTMALIPEGMAVEGVGNAAVNQELFEEAVALSDAGDYAGAVAKYEEFMVANPHLDAVHGNIGNAYRDAGDVEKAREAYEKLLAAEPDNVMANYNMGEMFIEAGDMEEALPYFEAVLQQNPDDPAVYYNVAELYFSQQVLGCLEPVPECQGAISYYNRALETDPNYLPAHMQIGFALVRLGDIDNAVLAFEKYVELAPEDDAQLPIVKDVLAALKTG